jgi:hypothetical protein
MSDSCFDDRIVLATKGKFIPKVSPSSAALGKT